MSPAELLLLYPASFPGEDGRPRTSAARIKSPPLCHLSYIPWRAREASIPHPPVLETGALPLELQAH